MRTKILWITPKWPLPADDGARKATVSLLSAVTKRGVDVDLLAVAGKSEVVDSAEAKDKLGVKNVFIVRRSELNSPSKRFASSIAHLGSALPITLLPYARSDIEREIHSIISSRNNWDYLLYDGLHPAAHSESSGRFLRNGFKGKIIYRAHNRESALWWGKSALTKSFLKRLLFSSQAAKVQRFEDSLVRSADLVATVSDIDLEAFRKESPGLNAQTVPIGLPFPTSVTGLPQGALRLLFIGRLDWAPNREGLTWFLDRVWAKVCAKRQDIALTVAGSGDGAWLKTYQGLRNFSVIGRVEDPTSLYASSDGLIVPIFYGSGTRVKVIEAASQGRAVISTALGVEGLGLLSGTQYLRAEKQQEWIDLLVGVKRETLRSVGANSYAALKENFDSEKVAQNFISNFGGGMNLRAVTKESLAGVLSSRPLSKLRSRYKGICSILMYHRVAQVSKAMPNCILGVAPDQFEAQMQHLASACTVLSLEAMLSGLNRGSLPANAVVVTFDDGFKDNLSAALPILERYKIPATIFITTKFIDGTLAAWWDQGAAMLTWEEVFQLSKHPLITIGAHTVSHPVLSSLTEAEVQAELKDSKQIIEQKIGKIVNFLAYPYGTLKHANGREFEIARRVGFQAAFTTNPGPLHARHVNDLFALPRYTVDGRYGLNEFIQQLSGTSALISSLIQPLVGDAESKARARST